MRQYVAYGLGFSGDYDTPEAAQRVVDLHGNGAVYVLAEQDKKRRKLLAEADSLISYIAHRGLSAETREEAKELYPRLREACR